jgi:hypothetical protein
MPCCFRELGLDLSVMIISAVDLIEVSKNLPDWWGMGEGQKHNALFVIPPATAQEVYNEVGEGRPEYENVSYYGNVNILDSLLREIFKNTLVQDSRDGCL